MEGEYELVCDISKYGASSNDLERTLNISQTATDTAIVTIEGE